MQDAHSTPSSADDLRLFNDLTLRAKAGAWAYVILWLCVAYSTGHHREAPYETLWAGLFFLLFLAGRTLFQKKGPFWFSVRPHLSWILFVCLALGPAILWGGLFAAAVTHWPLGEFEILMLVALMGIGSGGVTAFAPLPHLVFTFILALLGPASGVLLFRGEGQILLPMFLAYLIYMQSQAVRQAREYRLSRRNEEALKEKTSELERINAEDPLTGLHNRRFFFEYLQREWSRSFRNNKPCSLMILDVDFFKRINDQHGHPAGDACLRHLAQVLRSLVRRSGDEVARIGGEEFGIFLPETPLEGAVVLAERIRLEIEKQPLALEKGTIAMTVSIGVAAEVPDDLEAWSLLLELADQNLYQAKQGGRNKVIFSEFRRIHLVE